MRNARAADRAERRLGAMLAGSVAPHQLWIETDGTERSGTSSDAGEPAEEAAGDPGQAAATETIPQLQKEERVIPRCMDKAKGGQPYQATGSGVEPVETLSASKGFAQGRPHLRVSIPPLANHGTLP